MRRILFVSRYYASDFSLTVWGVYQRLRMLLEAAAASADALDVLFFVEQRVIDELGPAVSQASLKAHWGIDATVHLAPRALKTRGRVSAIVAATLAMRNQEELYKTGGKDQARAVASCVRADTDLIVCHRLDTGIAAVSARAAAVPIVMDLDDIEHVAFFRRLVRPPHSLKRRARFLELPALFAGEIATIRACRTTFVCSEADRAYLVRRGGSNLAVVSNAIAFAEEDDPAGDHAGDALLFLGSYTYEPNIEAAEYLMHGIFPLVVAQRPDARLMIAGNAVERLPSYRSSPPNVEFIGFVSDLSDIYRRVAVVCCPLRAGGGTRIKIIEAAARGKPVVSTTIGAEGLAFEQEKEILLRDTAQGFADACIALLDDRVRAAKLADAAYRKARRCYDRDAVVERIIANFRVAAAPRSDAPESSFTGTTSAP